MSWRLVFFCLFSVVLLYLTHGPLRAPLAEELAAAVPVVPVFSPDLDLSRAPLQTELEEPVRELTAGGFRFTPVAGFQVDARVLSRREYRFGKEARFCPVDLALGWGEMAKDEVLASFKIRQSNRFYFWRSDDLPISRDAVIRQSANMHLIPGSPEVFRAMKKVREGERVRMAGILVNVAHEGGLTRTTSTTRTDSGAGGCEIILVQRLEEAPLP